jgi:hypothetical protein
MSCRGQGAWALWYLGYPDQALQRSQAMLTLARDLVHPYTLALALNTASWTHFYRREGQAVCTLAEEAITLSRTQGFPHWLAMGMWMRGQAFLEQGQEEEGITQIQEGLTAYQTTGALIGTRGCGLAEVARGYGRRGQITEGLRIITEALFGLNQVRHYEAEMYRIKGELLLQQFEVQKSALRIPQSAIGSGGLFPEGCRHCLQTASKVLGTPRHHEPRTPLAATKQARRSTQGIIRGLQLVH